MRRVFLLAVLGVVALLFLGSGPLWAQGAVFNGDFETGSYSPMWILTGGNTYTQLVVWDSTPGVKSHCLKRQPGPPSSNGGIEQDVALVGGIQYVFSADIAAQYCTS